MVLKPNKHLNLLVGIWLKLNTINSRIYTIYGESINEAVLYKRVQEMDLIFMSFVRCMPRGYCSLRKSQEGYPCGNRGLACSPTQCVLFATVKLYFTTHPITQRQLDEMPKETAQPQLYKYHLYWISSPLRDSVLTGFYRESYVSHLIYLCACMYICFLINEIKNKLRRKSF